MKHYDVRVNLRSLRYFINEHPERIKFECYDRNELILLSYALLDEYRKIKFKKFLDTSHN